MAAASTFEALFNGRLRGLLQWREFDELWRLLRTQPEGWYVRDFSSSIIPRSPLPEPIFLDFLNEAEQFLRRRQRENYCGFIYLDDVKAPTFIKVFDPRKMGSSCGCSGGILPRWTISRQSPVLKTDLEPSQEQKEGLLARLFGK